MRKGARVSACLLLWEKRRRRGERERGGSVLMG